MTGQLIAFGLFIAALVGLMLLGLRDMWQAEDEDWAWEDE